MISRWLRSMMVVCTGLCWTANLYAANAIQTENAKPGSPDWQLTNPATNHEIEGYASLTSVNRGGQISFFVNTADPTFTVDVFRMGWYGGAGARRMMTPVQLTGTSQTIPTPNTSTGIIECQWINPYVLTIPTSTSDPTVWASGVYLARLTGTVSGRQSFIMFVVRDDARFSTYVFQLPVNTFQAYNNWGGKSLYAWNSTGPQAANVSFDRPYAMGYQPNSASGVGAAEFLTNIQPGNEGAPAGWSYNMLRFLEREGSDVTYLTDVDAHEYRSLVTNHQAVLVVGHSEYWSWQMRSNVEFARDSGIGVGFFSSNTCYWQVRFGPSSLTGVPDRTIIAYKENAAQQDPYASNPSLAYLTTTLWRNAPVNRPEDAFVGVAYVTDGINSDIVVSNAAHWVYTYTGLSNGAHLPGMRGYEVDGMQGNQPASTAAVAQEAIPGNILSTTVYTTASGTPVFATGSMQWSWGLDDFNAPELRPSVLNPSAQQITRNVLARLAGQPLAPAFSLVPSPRVRAVNPGSSVSYTITTTAFGYSPTLTLSVTGLPANVSYTFTPATVPGSGSSTLTITPDPSAALGTYLLTVGASDGVQTRTESVWLTISVVVNKSGWRLLYVDSQETACENGAAVNGFDGLASTIWHTRYCPGADPLPHEMQIDMGSSYQINAFRYLPRQDGGTYGRIAQFEFYASNNPSSWGVPLATGTFDNDATEKQVTFASGTYRYIRLRALTEVNGFPYTSMAELTLLQPSGGGSPPLVSIAVTPSNPTIGVGTTRQFTATGTYQAGGTQNITSQVTWSASTAAVTITAAGLATGQSAGSATITAAQGSVTGSTSATVQTGPVVVPKTNWTLVFVDSQETQCENAGAGNSFDNNPGTIWHTAYCFGSAQLPHEIQIDMGSGYQINTFRYLPRQDGGVNGRIGQFEFYATNTLSNWGAPLATGTFANDAAEKQVTFAANTYRYIRLRALTEVNGGAWTSMAELTVMQP